MSALSRPTHLLLAFSLPAAWAAACSSSVSPTGSTSSGGSETVGSGTGGKSTATVGTGTGSAGGPATSTTSAGGASTGTGAAGGAPPDASDDGACAEGTTRPCATSCGSTGTETCAAGAWSACAPPRETCNLADDDCNGSCDDVLGCRIGVDRSYAAAAGLHFYTTTDSEATCCGYSLEVYRYYYLYGAQQPGLVPFYRCSTSKGAHLYTTDASCGGGTLEGTMGWIATGPVCGSVPLHHLYLATSGDHFYTTSDAEASAAQAGGYADQGTAGYVWPAECGGSGCTWPSPVHMVGSTTTAATGFPTAWYGFPIDPGPQSFATLSGTVTVTQTQSLYAETLFILQYLPSGACQSGLWPASTPEYGPPGALPLAQFIVKAPTAGSFTVPINLTLPGGLPMSSCVLLGLNGGPVAASHAVTSSADLTLSFTAAQSPAQSVLGAGGEFCFGQSWGCQGATTNDALSFANVTPIGQAAHLVALYGDISDSTFDGTGTFGAPPAGAWTATNDIYLYHGAECAAFGVPSGTAGPGDYYASIPADAVHLLSVPLSGTGIGVSEGPVFKAFSSTALAPGDCLVTLWGLQGGGGFDNETQIFALIGP